MTTQPVIIGILMSLLLPASSIADGDHCGVPMSQWQPREFVEQLAKANGWTVLRIKIDDGCYEIKGRDQNGHAIEAKVDPGSLAVIKVEHDDDGDDYHSMRGIRLEAVTPREETAK